VLEPVDILLIVIVIIYTQTISINLPNDIKRRTSNLQSPKGFCSLESNETEKPTPNSTVHHRNPVPRQHLIQRNVTPDPDSPGG